MINNARRNAKGNLTGRATCPVCSTEFQFETNINSNEIVINSEQAPKSIGVPGGSHKLFKIDYKAILQVEVVSECPNCKRKFKHNEEEKI